MATLVLLLIPLILMTYGLIELFQSLVIKESHPRFRRLAVIVLLGLVLLLLFVLYPRVLDQAIEHHIAGLFGVGIYLHLDLLSLSMMILTTIIFLAVQIDQYQNITCIDQERSFTIFTIVAYSFALGSFLAGDLLAFFLSFELMTFSSYGLFVHERQKNPAALESGYMYIVMGIIGGLFVLSGIMLVYALSGSFHWSGITLLLQTPSFVNTLIIGLFVLGFGIKMAMVPFQFWLPYVYKNAPWGVNALSSGILSKVSAYGLLKVITMIYALEGSSIDIVKSLEQIKPIAVVLMVLGLLSMFVGVLLALIEEDIKRLLTYHSVSQMGYIVLSIAMAAYLGVQGPLALTAALYHMINHALFKSALFILAGIIVRSTNESNLYRIGGIFKDQRNLALLSLIPVLGIMGMIGFNGFASKTLIHHAIAEVNTYGTSALVFLEWGFLIVSAGTVTSFMKFYGFIFLAKGKEPHRLKFNSGWMAVAFLSVFIIFIGLQPKFLLNVIFIPLVRTFYYDPYFIDKYLVPLKFFTYYELMSMLKVFGIAIGMFLMGLYFNLFHLHLPKWLSSERIFYRPIQVISNRFPNFMVRTQEKRFISMDVMMFVGLLTVALILMLIGLLR